MYHVVWLTAVQWICSEGVYGCRVGGAGDVLRPFNTQCATQWHIVYLFFVLYCLSVCCCHCFWGVCLNYSKYDNYIIVPTYGRDWVIAWPEMCNGGSEKKIPSLQDSASSSSWYRDLVKVALSSSSSYSSLRAEGAVELWVCTKFSSMPAFFKVLLNLLSAALAAFNWNSEREVCLPVRNTMHIQDFFVLNKKLFIKIQLHTE